jgi:hypothetical protein
MVNGNGKPAQDLLNNGEEYEFKLKKIIAIYKERCSSKCSLLNCHTTK